MKHSCKIILESRKKNGELIVTNVPILASIAFGGERFFYATGLRIDRSKFDAQQQQVQKNSTAFEGTNAIPYNIANKRFTAIKAALNSLFEGSPTRAEVIETLDTLLGKRKSLPGYPLIDLFRKYLVAVKVSESRKQNIAATINHWQRFEANTGGTLSVDMLTPALLRTFDRWLETDVKPKGRNTRHKIMVMTRAFWRFYTKLFVDAGFVYPFGVGGYSIPAESYGTPIYITSSERDALAGMQVPSERLAKVRDMFILQCFIGCRVGDLLKLTKSNLIGDSIQYIPRKTKEGHPVTVTVPLHPTARKIVESYSIPDGRLLPYLVSQKYNEYLKELFELAGLTRVVMRINPLSGEPESVRLCDIASSHMARKAFVGNLFGRVDSGVISAMSGHVPNSKTFTRYYAVSDELKSKAIEIL